MKRCGAARLPRQLGPDTAMPAASIAWRSRTASSRPFGSPPSPKPPENTVALRAFTLPASAMVSIAAAPGTITTTWSGASGRSESDG